MKMSTTKYLISLTVLVGCLLSVTPQANSQQLSVNSPSYVGCFGDWTLRDLYIWFKQFDSLTLETCTNFCLNSGYIYAGAQGYLFLNTNFD